MRYINLSLHLETTNEQKEENKNYHYPAAHRKAPVKLGLVFFKLNDTEVGAACDSLSLLS